jgi:phosphoribosylformylglycinamidine synthase
LLFSEDQGRAIVTCEPAQVSSVLDAAAQHGVPAMDIGSTGGNELRFGHAGLTWRLEELRAAWETPL